MSSFDNIKNISIKKERNCVYTYNQIEKNIDKFIVGINGNIKKLEEITISIYKSEDEKEKKRLIIDHKRCLQQLESLLKSLRNFKRQLALAVDCTRFEETTSLTIEKAEHSISDSYKFTASNIIDAPVVNDERDLIRERVQLEYDPLIDEERITTLNNDIRDINDVMLALQNGVVNQGEHVSKIDENIQTSCDNVESGSNSLTKAAKYSYATLSTTGALIGGAICGPIGMVVGLKLGALAALSGGVVGFTGGKYWSKKQTENLYKVEDEILINKEE